MREIAIVTGILLLLVTFSAGIVRLLGGSFGVELSDSRLLVLFLVAFVFVVPGIMNIHIFASPRSSESPPRRVLALIRGIGMLIAATACSIPLITTVVQPAVYLCGMVIGLIMNFGTIPFEYMVDRKSMDEHIDIDAWKEDGKTLWQHIQGKGELAFAWRNPWFRLIVISFCILAVSFTSHFLLHRLYVSIVVALFSLLFICPAVKFYILDRRAGGLHFFYTKESFGIGGAHERIAIPYSSVVMPKNIPLSTVNNNYIVLPIPPENFATISVLDANGDATTWDKRPFKQAIADIRIEDSTLIAKAKPNEFIVHLFSTLYPLLMYLNQGSPAEADAGNA